MKLSFTLQIEAKKEHIWRYYADIKKWSLWEEDLEEITLENDFTTGTKGVMKLKGMPALKFELTSVIKNKEFTDKTDMPMGSLYFSHEIFEENGKTYIKHSVSLENAEISEENIKFLGKIFEDVPMSMLLIKKRAEEK